MNPVLVSTPYKPHAFSAHRWAAVITLAALTASSWGRADTVSVPPLNVVNVSASSFLEAPQDWLQISLGTTREASDAAAVQTQLKQALDAALAKARSAAKPGQLEVRTGGFQISPRYANNGKINGWRGSAELVLEGRDFATISQVAGRIDTLTVSQTGFSLSREARQKLESDVQAQAIERFKGKAQEVARSFGFGGFRLREVSVSSVEPEGGPVYPRMRAMAVSSPMADAPVPVEAGRSTISVTVSGAIQLQ